MNKMNKIFSLVLLSTNLVGITNADPILKSQPYPVDVPQPDYFIISDHPSDTIILSKRASINEEEQRFLEVDLAEYYTPNIILRIRACNSNGCSGGFLWTLGDIPGDPEVYLQSETIPFVEVSQ
jgi:hypothetical protein